MEVCIPQILCVTKTLRELKEGDALVASHNRRRRTKSHNSYSHRRRSNILKWTKQAGNSGDKCDEVNHSLKNRRMRRRRSALIKSSLDKSHWTDDTLRHSISSMQHLETHLWHSKRFLMVDTVWGWRLPKGNVGKGRGSRALVKRLQNSTVIHDASYWCPLCIKGIVTQVLGVFESFIDHLALSRLYKALDCLDDQGIEIETTIYEPGKIPLGALGPLKLLVLPDTGDEVDCVKNFVFCLYLHGSIAQRSFRLLKQEFLKARSVHIFVADLRRVELVGAGSSNSLLDALLPVSVYKDLRIKDMEAGEALQISLIHPRALKPVALGTTSMPLLSESTIARLASKTPIDIFDKTAAGPISGIYFDNIRSKTRKNLTIGMDTANKLEVEGIQQVVCSAIVIKNPRSSTSWSLVVPSGWMMPVWMALIFQNCQPAGQREWHWIHTLNKKAFFPQDAPDCFPQAASPSYQESESSSKLDTKSNGRKIDSGDMSPMNIRKLLNDIWQGEDIRPFVARTFDAMFAALFGLNIKENLDWKEVNFNIACRNLTRWSLAQEGWEWVPRNPSREKARLGCLVEVLVYQVKRGPIKEGAKLMVVKGREAEASSLPVYMTREPDMVAKERDSVDKTNVVYKAELEDIGFVTSNAPYGSTRVVPSLGFCSASSFWRLRCLQFYARKKGEIPVHAWAKNTGSNALFPVKLKLNMENS